MKARILIVTAHILLHFRDRTVLSFAALSLQKNLQGCKRLPLVICLCYFILAFSDTHAFIHNRSDAGKPLFWNRSINTLTITVNPVNNDDLDNDVVGNIISFSIADWESSNGNIFLLPELSYTETEVKGSNNFYFSSEDIFGRGVLAITRILHSNETGEIHEADIIINDRINFSVDSNATSNSSGTEGYFLGDIVGHELGHLFGLGHGQVHESTMTFTAFRGQYSLHSDDKEGLGAIYASSDDTSRGSIRGIVAGAESVIGVFGAQVQAISSTTGKMIASAATSSNGRFSLSSLPVDDTYYLYVSPLRTSSGLPDYYDTIRSNFCTNGLSWQGSYFQKCGVGEEGRPQGILLSTGEVIDVGTITISCGFSALSANAENSDFDYELNIVRSGDDIGEVVTGYFLDTEIQSNTNETVLNDSTQRTGHIYSIDLTDYTPDTTKDIYLDIKIVAQAVYSPLRMSIIVGRTGESGQMFPSTWSTVNRVSELDYTSTTQTSNYHLDHSGEFTIHFPLDEATPDNNSFSIELIPRPLTQGLVGVGISDLFPSSSALLNTVGHYLMILTISERDDLGHYSVIKEKGHTPYSDNLSCMDGANAFAVAANVSAIAAPIEHKKKKSIISPLCGAINIGGPGSGPGEENFILIFLISIFMLVLGRKKGKKKGFSF